jgi:hypothetical protein
MFDFKMTVLRYVIGHLQLWATYGRVHSACTPFVPSNLHSYPTTAKQLCHTIANGDLQDNTREIQMKTLKVQ